ncbi:AAA family ATPase [Sorangium sp. So ce117]|uniref:AAA family ATPase n=1 Tax=Sorangium sp. So ce117 TaxID=3133277 RepID=UPI003F5E8EB4
MSYTPIFNPATQASARPEGASPYVYEPGLELAVNVALAARRPLLLRGAPGAGKSSLALNVALCLERNYDEEVITSRTQAQDLLYRFDVVRRLADVQAGARRDDAHYVEPGILWRALNASSAQQLGTGVPAQPAPDQGLVVLLDEIDKADPDVPNDLLVVLDQRWFFVRELGRRVEAQPGIDLFLIITTNGERDLPSAFVRRCVVFEIHAPDRPRMKKIAQAHFPGAPEALLEGILDVHEELTRDAKGAQLRPPSTAETIDAVRSCLALGITDTQAAEWRTVVEAAMWKHASRARGAA